MIRKSSVIMGLCFSLLLLTGCKPSCLPEDYENFDIILDGPVDGEIVGSLKPTFSWHHDEYCKPDKYMLVAENWPLGGDKIFYVSGDKDSLVAESDLKPGSNYHWHMAATTDSINPVYGRHSETRSFLTGPVCDGPITVKPTLFSPVKGTWISSTDPSLFDWNTQGCLPSSFQYQFATDINFQNVIHSGETQGNEYSLELEFPSCSSLFWRVRGTSPGLLQKNYGPYSDPSWFYWVTDDPCTQNQFSSQDTAIILGRVFVDECSESGFVLPQNSTLETGCVQRDSHNVTADSMLSGDEINRIEGVVVQLGSGPCPSTGLDEILTDLEGIFQFYVQTPGEYCLTVQKDHPENDPYVSNDIFNSYPDLNDGIWTLPFTYGPNAQQTVQIMESVTGVTIEFGWDELEHPLILVQLSGSTNCRSGPSIFYPIVEISGEGDLVQVLAKDEESDWKLILLNDIECFMNLPLDEKESLPVFDPPPPPLPTPTPIINEPTRNQGCSAYATRELCNSAGCVWNGSTHTCGGE